MKKFASLIMIMFFALPVFSQEEETIFNGKFESGGFGGPVVSVTQIAGKPSLLVGGRGGWIINHTFVIGGGGYGLSTELIAQNPYGRDFRMELGYGGLELEYIMNSKNAYHFTAKVLIGGGEVSWKDNYNNMWESNNGMNRYGTDAFFVVEPTANIELNLTNWFRLNFGASYRLITGVDSKLLYDNHVLTTLKDSDLSGASGAITFKFGSF